MFAPSHDPAHRSPFRDVVVVSLMLGIVALGVIVCRQRLEIRRLAQAKMAELEAPSVTLRQARTRALGVRPVRKETPGRDELRAMDDAMLAGASEVVRDFKARPQPANALARLMENPEFYQALERHRQSALDARFAGLFRRLALGPEELAQFKRLLAEKDNVALEVLAVAETQAEPMPETTVNAGVNAARAKVEDEIRASLGNDRYAVYREYEQTQPQRAVVLRLEQRLSYSSTPLSPPQAEALVRILTANAPAPAPEQSTSSAVVVGAGAPNALARLQTETAAARVSESAYKEALTVLTPPQQQALKEIQTEQQASLLTLQLIRDSIPVNERKSSERLRLLLQ